MRHAVPPSWCTERAVALLWHKNVAGTRYEVRSAGQTRRLYTDGVFHSQYSPAQPVTGGVWDLLLLPAFFLPPAARLRRVLLLGVGGGAVIRQLKHFLDPPSIVGVELNPVHLSVARRFFGVRPAHAELHLADARRWMARYDGPPFDYIIDDLYGEQDGEPVRAVAATVRWAETLLRHLAPQGVLASNFVSARELRESAYQASTRVRRRYATAFQLSTPQNENAVGVFVRATGASAGGLRQRLAGIPGLDPARRSCRLRYRIRRLTP